MPITSGNTTLSGVSNIGVTGTNYAITQTSSGIVRFPLTPAFRAYGTPGTSSGNVIIWSNTSYNQGTHYATGTGRFTAPLAGKYFFMWGNIGNNSQTTFRYFLRLNGSSFRGDWHLRLDASHNDTGDRYGPNGARVAIVDMNLNDYVEIYYSSDNGTADYAGSSEIFGFFQGWLIS